MTVLVMLILFEAKFSRILRCCMLFKACPYMTLLSRGAITGTFGSRKWKKSSKTASFWGWIKFSKGTKKQINKYTYIYKKVAPDLCRASWTGYIVSKSTIIHYSVARVGVYTKDLHCLYWWRTSSASPIQLSHVSKLKDAISTCEVDSKNFKSVTWKNSFWTGCGNDPLISGCSWQTPSLLHCAQPSEACCNRTRRISLLSSKAFQ